MSTTDMIKNDGSRGEGGGQILRSALLPIIMLAIGCVRAPAAKARGPSRPPSSKASSDKATDCRAVGGDSGPCNRHGLCTYRDGECVAASDADCLESDYCFSAGQCSAREGTCVATGDQCSDSVECERYGRCTARRGVCVAAFAADCRRSYGCKADGECRARKGLCVVGSAADCGRSEGCRLHGSCSLIKRIVCGVRSSLDCGRSEACREHNKCVARGQKGKLLRCVQAVRRAE